MKIFSTKQIAEIDQYTIKNEPINDIDLMERASLQVVNWILINISNELKVKIFVGPGNNGGDALAIARLLADHDYQCHVYLLDFGKKLKGSSLINWNRLKVLTKVQLQKIKVIKDIPELNENDLVLDGLFGAGLNRKLEGIAADIVNAINRSSSKVVAIDMPSGLFGEDNSANDLSKVVKADYTLTFQFPKLCFFFPEHEQLIGSLKVLPIGLHPEAIYRFETPYKFLNKEFISGRLKQRTKFSHKGTFGHALLIAGSYGKMGACVLGSKACLRSGVGLLTAHVPHHGYQIIQMSVPEAMCSIDQSDLMFTEAPGIGQFSAIGVGPGIGVKPNSKRALKELLATKPVKLVIDADGLNILSQHKEWLELLPANSILTPHPKEFERLVGEWGNSWSRLQLQIEFSKKYNVIVVLKGANSSITMPDGRVYFNTTGNPGMATAGSGDVLTGIILGILAQDYSAEEAALIAVYLHGFAGDIAVKYTSHTALTAGDIINEMGNAFLQLDDSKS